MRTALFALIVTAACVPRSAYSPRTGTMAGDRQTIYSRALGAVSDMGMTAETNDPVGGIIVTSWDCGVDTEANCLIRHRYRITVSDGTFEVAIHCQERFIREAQYQSCEGNKMPTTWVETQDKLAATIEDM